MKVVVLTYHSHKDSDVSVYTTEELAIQGACKHIENNLEEINDVVVRLQLRVLIERKDWQKVLDVWSAYQEEHSSECFEFNNCEVVDANTT